MRLCRCHVSYLATDRSCDLPPPFPSGKGGLFFCAGLALCLPLSPPQRRRPVAGDPGLGVASTRARRLPGKVIPVSLQATKQVRLQKETEARTARVYRVGWRDLAPPLTQGSPVGRLAAASPGAMRVCRGRREPAERIQGICTYSGRQRRGPALRYDRWRKPACQRDVKKVPRHRSLTKTASAPISCQSAIVAGVVRHVVVDSPNGFGMKPETVCPGGFRAGSQHPGGRVHFDPSDEEHRRIGRSSLGIQSP